DRRDIEFQLRSELDQDVGGLFDELRTAANQEMTTACERVVNGPRNREDLASVIRSEPRSDQRAAAPRRLDDERAERPAGDDPIPLGEVRLVRLDARRVFRHE